MSALTRDLSVVENSLVHHSVEEVDDRGPAYTTRLQSLIDLAPDVPGTGTIPLLPPNVMKRLLLVVFKHHGQTVSCSVNR